MAETTTKVSGKSQKEAVLAQVQGLQPGQVLMYQTLPLYGGNLGIFMINPDYPEKSKKKFCMYREDITDGKPSGKRYHIWTTNDAKGLAYWVTSRAGKLYEPPK